MLRERLKKLREEAGYTQQQLAKMVKLSQQTIGHYEVGRASPDIDTLEMFADLFGTTVDYILGRTDIKAPIETIAAHRTDDPTQELPEEARRSLEEFKDYILKKYGKK